MFIVPKAGEGDTFFVLLRINPKVL